MRIYTRTGDTGFSSTGNRRMIPKNSPVFSLLGALEELDASLGEAAGKLPAGLSEVAGTLRRDVAALSAELSGGEKFADAARVRGMEESIDLMISLFPYSLGAFFCTGMRVPSLKTAHPNTYFFPVQLNGKTLLNPLGIVYHKDRFLPRYAQDFMERLKSFFASFENSSC